MKRLQIPQKILYEKFYRNEKIYVDEIPAVNLSKICFLKNTKKTCKPNNCDLNRDWISNMTEKLRGGISKFTVPGPLIPSPIFFHIE